MSEKYGDSHESTVNPRYEKFYSDIESRLTEAIKWMGGDKFRWGDSIHPDKRISQSFSFMKGWTAHAIEVNAKTNAIVLIRRNFDGPPDREEISLDSLVAKFRSSR